MIKDGNVKLLKKLYNFKLMDSSAKDRLKKKLKNKKESRAGKSTEKIDEDNLFTMLNQVNKMLKENPNMVKKVSKCVNSIFENKDLMNTLKSEIGSKINLNESESLNNNKNNNENNNENNNNNNQDSHTLVNNSDEDKLDASLKEDKQ